MNFRVLETTEVYKDKVFEGKYILAPSSELTQGILVDLSMMKACASMAQLRWQCFSLRE